MARLIGAIVLAGGIFALPATAEDMASKNHPVWLPVEGSGCLVWNAAPAAGAGVTASWSGLCQNGRASGKGELV